MKELAIPPSVWRERLHRALLEELVLQEIKAGKPEAFARALAERRLAAAAYKARRQQPPEPEDLPEEILQLIDDPWEP